MPAQLSRIILLSIKEHTHIRFFLSLDQHSKIIMYLGSMCNYRLTLTNDTHTFTIRTLLPQIREGRVWVCVLL